MTTEYTQPIEKLYDIETERELLLARRSSLIQQAEAYASARRAMLGEVAEIEKVLGIEKKIEKKKVYGFPIKLGE